MQYIPKGFHLCIHLLGLPKPWLLPALSAECWWDFSVPYNNANFEVRHFITSAVKNLKIFLWKIPAAHKIQICVSLPIFLHGAMSRRLVTLFLQLLHLNLKVYQLYHFYSFFEIKWNASELNYTNHVLSYVSQVWRSIAQNLATQWEIAISSISNKLK